jgi:hypothetical protein
VDAKRFDQFVHRMASASTRRVALTEMLGVLTGALILTGAERAEAKRKRRKRKKKNVPNGIIPPPPSPPVSPPPPPAIVCTGATKACGLSCIPEADCCGGCGQGQTCCKGACANRETNGQHCGICGNVCASGFCIHGACDCRGTQANCPASCACAALRANGESACISSSTNDACDSDDDCDLGSVCLVTNACSNPCVP